MREPSEKNTKFSLYFYTFLIAHVALWTILPLLIRGNLHLDTLEAIALGNEWQLGYYKHPPLSNWLAQLVVVIFGKNVWACYFISQVCVAFAMIAVWKLAKLFLPIAQALMATVLLEGIYYYNFTSVEFNTNILLLALWSWIILYAWKSCTENLIRDWIVLGILCALGILTKYYVTVLMASIFLMMLYDDKFRQHLKTIKPYFAIVSFFAIAVWHFIWLMENNYPSLNYVADRFSTGYKYHHHLTFPLLFSISQVASFSFALLAFFLAFAKGFKIKTVADFTAKSDKTKRTFLFFMLLMPFFLTILPSLLTGSKLKDMWGTTLWSLYGVFLFYYFKPTITAASSRKFYISIASIMLLSATTYTASFLIAPKFKPSKRDNFNGKLVAQNVTQAWRRYYDTPLKIVVGDIWLTSNVNFYSPDSPRIFLDMDVKQSPWFSYHDLKENGAVVIWNAKAEGDSLPERFKNKIDNKIIVEDPIIVPAIVAGDNAEPYRLGLAIILRD